MSTEYRYPFGYTTELARTEPSASTAKRLRQRLQRQQSGQSGGCSLRAKNNKKTKKGFTFWLYSHTFIALLFKPTPQFSTSKYVFLFSLVCCEKVQKMTHVFSNLSIILVLFPTRKKQEREPLSISASFLDNDNFFFRSVWRCSFLFSPFSFENFVPLLESKMERISSTL